MEVSLLVAAILSAGAGWAALRLEEAKGMLAVTRREAWDTVVLACVAGVAAGRLAHLVASGVDLIHHSADLFVIRGGVSSGWASLTAIGVCIASTARRRLPSLLDQIAPAALASLSAWHASCLIRASCLGDVTGLPIGWHQSGSTLRRHPVELYASVLLLSAAIAAFMMLTRRVPRLLVASLSLAMAGTSRLITEPLRPSFHGGPTGWYTSAVAAGLVVAALVVVAGRRAVIPRPDRRERRPAPS
jgi:prolipoprotein diacylglyceryltransferase